jgi:hypothetical protein
LSIPRTVEFIGYGLVGNMLEIIVHFHERRFEVTHGLYRCKTFRRIDILADNDIGPRNLRFKFNYVFI